MCPTTARATSGASTRCTTLPIPSRDAIEGITHSLCSLEFENHRPLYEWVIANTVGGEFPKQREFARLNMTNTVMSKRYLRELVEKNIVDGWDDPRMPTLSGLRRRGYTPRPASLPLCSRPAFPKADSLVDMRQMEAVLRAELELSAQRRIAVLDPVKLVIDNYPEGRCETFELPQQPQPGRRRRFHPPRPLHPARCGSTAAISLRSRRPSSSA